MKSWKFEKLDLDGAYLITPFCAEDARGNFIKDYSIEVFNKNGISYNLKEVFYATSSKNVLRGMHFQTVNPQAKLVRCIKGKIYDVIIDLRKNSPTFMKSEGFYLDDKNLNELLVPIGFAHGYLVIEDAIVVYKCAEVFDSEHDSGIRFDDKNMNIAWPFAEIGGKQNVILSEKDKKLQSFQNYLDSKYVF